MRVTEQQVFANITTQMNRNWEKVIKVQDRLSSGQEIQNASDDPVTAARVSQLDDKLQLLEDFGRNANLARNNLEPLESTLGEASQLLIRAKEIAVQGASDPYQAESRAAMAIEVREMFASLVSIGNLEVNGKYLLSGYLSDQQAFLDDGTFAGDPSVVEFRVGPGVTVKAGLNGDEVFKGAGGGVDVFGVLDDLATALEANDATAVQTTLAGLDQAMDQINLARTQASSRLEKVVSAQTWSERLRISALQARSESIDTDIAQASMEMTLAQQALQATLATVPRVMAQSILDYL